MQEVRTQLDPYAGPPMPAPPKKKLTAAYWYKRAEKANVLAERMNDRQTRDLMIGVANDYTLIAQRIERRSAQTAEQPPKQE